jgi:hypothetical protein
MNVMRRTVTASCSMMVKPDDDLVLRCATTEGSGEEEALLGVGSDLLHALRARIS